MSSEASLQSDSVFGFPPVAALGSQAAGGGEPEFRHRIAQITTVTKEMFGGPVSCALETDPENPREQWIVFHCAAEGGFAQYRERFDQWHEKVAAIAPESIGVFRLNVIPRS